MIHSIYEGERRGFFALGKNLGLAPQYVEFIENSTKLRLLIADRDQLGDRPIDGVPRGAGYYLVSVVEHGAYWLQPGSLHSSYVAEKLGVTAKDAEALIWLLDEINHTRAGGLQPA